MTTTDVTAPAPPDQGARDAVRERLDATLFVEAGAGTGKTTALVGRVVELVRSGVPMRNLAAITFTEAAAAELRDRVRHALEAAASAGAVPASAAAEVDEAAISTLHAFAQRILADHPLEAGLPPTIEVLDEIESGLAFEEQWAAFVDTVLDDPSAESVLLRGLALDLKLDRLREIARLLHDHRDRIDPAAPPPPPPTPLEPAPALLALREAIAHADCCTGEEDRLAEHLTRLASVAERLAAAADDVEVLQLLNSSRRWSCGYGQRDNWTVDVDTVRDACTIAEDARAAVVRTAGQEVVAHLLHRIAGFTVAAADERRRAGRLDFHDLLVGARDLLRSQPGVRGALHHRYTHLLVDEFQDTDPLQVELAVLLAAPATGSAPVAHWHDASVDPGRLFFVGDAKQSIYRFRRADIALFLDVRQRVADDVLELSANFRSVPGVLAWVNAIFGVLIGEGVEGAQAAYHPLDAVRSPIAGQPADAVVLIGDAVDRPLDEVREAEAADIAETVLRIVEQEQWLVSDADDPARTRPARLADIAVLLPTRTTLPQLEAAFDEADIPYRVESSSLVWSTQGVRDLLSVLQAVDDPTDEVAIVAALRSPALACTDDDLVTYRRAGGRWNLRAPCPDSLDPGNPVCRGKAVLRALHDRRWWQGVAGMVERVARELRFFELAFAHPRPRDHWRRLRFVIDQALAFEAAGGRTLRDFVAWADQQATDEARVREPVVPDRDDDAVRVLTVHGAKGLEFPIVVLTGLNRSSRGALPLVLWDRDRPEARLYTGFETAGYGELHTLEKAMVEHEEIRLLYVAATRARDHLVVSLHHKLGTQCPAARLADLGADDAVPCRRLGSPLLRLMSPPAGRPPRPDAGFTAERQRWSAQRATTIAQARRAPVVAATAVAEAAGAHDDDARAEPISDQPFRRGRGGTAVGRAVHAAMQAVDLATGQGLDGLAAAAAAAEGIPESADRVAALARAALDSEVVRTAVRRRHWRELYVGAPVVAPGGSRPTVLEGFVDLVFEDGDDLVVVDYKTDALGPDVEAGLDAAVRRYRLQVAAYAVALEKVTGRRVSRAVLLFVGDGVGRERAVADLTAATREVHRSLVTASDT